MVTFAGKFIGGEKGGSNTSEVLAEFFYKYVIGHQSSAS